MREKEIRQETVEQRVQQGIIARKGQFCINLHRGKDSC